MNKQEIRKKMLKKRNQLSKNEQDIYSEKISKLILESDIYRDCDNICIYQTFRNEVSCDKIMERAFCDNKKVFVPVTNMDKKTMEFYQITEETRWQSGAYGILEPELSDTTPVLKEPALILMPGLVFDKKKHRIGYGGGYYDKYLSVHKNHIKIALCYHFQIIEEILPFEEHDILPDYIVTDVGIF